MEIVILLLEEEYTPLGQFEVSNLTFLLNIFRLALSNFYPLVLLTRLHFPVEI